MCQIEMVGTSLVEFNHTVDTCPIIRVPRHMVPLALPPIHAEVAATYVKLHAPCAAHGKRQRGGCGRDALLHVIHAPCARSPLSRLPHRSGCWVRDSCAEKELRTRSP